MTSTRAEHLTGVIAGTAAVTAYLTGVFVGVIARHPGFIAGLALAVSASHASTHRPRRPAATGTHN
jgi:hypothetical protein